MRERIEQLWDLVWDHLPGTVVALTVLVFGWIAIRFVVRWGKKKLAKADVDPTLVTFLGSVARFLLKVLLLLAVAGMLGVETTSFLAILGAAGLAIGLALKDSLSHFASGILIIIFHPYRVEDLIELPGIGIARVERITILYTYLRTLDNRQVVVPNGQLANGTVVNLSANDLRRVDLPFGVAYGDSLDLIRRVMLEVANQNPRTQQDPAPRMTVDRWADSSLTVTLRVWCATDDYFELYWELLEGVKKAFNANGLEIPFPHQVAINRFPGGQVVISQSS